MAASYDEKPPADCQSPPLLVAALDVARIAANPKEIWSAGVKQYDGRTLHAGVLVFFSERCMDFLYREQARFPSIYAHATGAATNKPDADLELLKEAPLFLHSVDAAIRTQSEYAMLHFFRRMFSAFASDDASIVRAALGLLSQLAKDKPPLVLLPPPFQYALPVPLTAEHITRMTQERIYSTQAVPKQLLEDLDKKFAKALAGDIEKKFLEKLGKSGEKIKTEKARAEKAKADLEAEVAALREGNKALEEEKKKLLEDRVALVARNVALELQLKKMNDEDIPALIEAAKKTGQDELAVAKAQQAAMEEERKKAIEENQKLEADIVAMGEARKKLEAEVAAVQKQMQEDIAKAREETRAGLKQDIAAHEAEERKLKEEAAGLKGMNEGLEEQIAKLNEDVKKLAAVKGASEEQLQQINKAIEDIQKQKADLESERKRLEDERARVQGECEESRRAKEKAEQEKKAAEAARASAVQDLEESAKQLVERSQKRSEELIALKDLPVEAQGSDIEALGVKQFIEAWLPPGANQKIKASVFELLKKFAEYGIAVRERYIAVILAGITPVFTSDPGDILSVAKRWNGLKLVDLSAIAKSGGELLRGQLLGSIVAEINKCKLDASAVGCLQEIAILKPSPLKLSLPSAGGRPSLPLTPPAEPVAPSPPPPLSPRRGKRRARIAPGEVQVIAHIVSSTSYESPAGTRTGSVAALYNALIEAKKAQGKMI